MSQITQCPACATMFKVVADQLRISEGWVRCGQCDAVFDANAHLQSRTLDTVTPASHEGDAVNSPGGAANQDPATSQEDGDGNATMPVFEQDEDRLSGAGNAAISVDIAQDVVQTVEEVSQSAYVVANNDDPIEDVLARYPDADSKNSFMRSSAIRTRWEGKAARAILGLSVVLLAAGLTMQIVVHERDRIATAVPGLKPVLVSACSVLACQIEPMRQIESIVIDSSSFVNVRADVFRLKFTLKNTALLDIAAPAVELTLTDLQDQPVLRRVIAPKEFGVFPIVLAASAELNATLPINVQLPEGLGKFAGYRLMIFYP